MLVTVAAPGWENWGGGGGDKPSNEDAKDI